MFVQNNQNNQNAKLSTCHQIYKKLQDEYKLNHKPLSCCHSYNNIIQQILIIINGFPSILFYCHFIHFWLLKMFRIKIIKITNLIFLCGCTTRDHNLEALHYVLLVVLQIVKFDQSLAKIITGPYITKYIYYLLFQFGENNFI